MEATLPETDELVDPIYSFGTDPAMTSIIQLIHKKHVDVVAINIWTLARNVMDKEKDIDENLEMLIENITAIVSNLSFTFSNVNVIKNPFVYFYMYSYDQGVPDTYLRKSESEQKKLLFNLCNQYYKYQIGSTKKELSTTKYDNLNVVTDVTKNNREPSYRSMIKVISSCTNRHIVALLTHMPMDAHIFQNFDTYMVRSHTGEVCDRRRYGNIVFGLDIPFNKSVHVLLGDKETVKGFLQRKTKTEMIDRSKSAMWHQWTLSKIETEIGYVYSLPYKLP